MGEAVLRSKNSGKDNRQAVFPESGRAARIYRNMATDKDFARHMQELLYDCGDVIVRPMMGEYIVKYRDKTIGGLYDNRFLVKPTKTAMEMLPDAPTETPYPGAKDMLHVDNIHDLEDIPKLRILFEAVYDELPAPKPRRKKDAGRT